MRNFNFKTLLPTGLVASVVILAGCGQKGSEKAEYKPQDVKKIDTVKFEPGKEDLLFPVAVGNEWSYTAEINYRATGRPPEPTRSIDLRFRCTQVVKTPRGTRVTMEVVTEGKVNEVQEWVLNDQGLYQSSVGYPPKPFTPPQGAFRRPMKVGAKFEWSGTGFRPDGVVGKSQSTSTVMEPQLVDTELGQVEAYPVKSESKWNGPDGKTAGGSVSTTWWAPGYGIVRYRQEAVNKNGVAVQIMRLRSVSLKKE